MFTIQKNRTTKYSSLVIDMDTDRVYPNYPSEDDLHGYSKESAGCFIYRFKDGLDTSVFRSKVQGVSTHSEKPFCCSDLKPFRARDLNKEEYFSDFFNSFGTRSDVVYEVNRQVYHGDGISKKFFKLENGVTSVLNRKFSQKVHSFKSYTCFHHNLFFTVDLFRAQNIENDSKFHHLCLNPFTNIDFELLNDFFDVTSNS